MFMAGRQPFGYFSFSGRLTFIMLTLHDPTPIDGSLTKYSLSFTTHDVSPLVSASNPKPLNILKSTESKNVVAELLKIS